MGSELFEEEASFACAGVEYAFRRWSRGGACVPPAAPVVLLHGFAQSSSSWGEVASLLLESEAFDSVYALDFAGHGKSPGVDCGESPDAGCGGEGARPDDARACEMDASCETVRSFVELVVRREGAAPVLVGYSMGGRIALECLVRYGVLAGGSCVVALGGHLADRDASSALPISALVLESAGLGPADEDMRLGLEKRNIAWARRLREEGVASFMDHWQDLPLFESQRALSPERRAAQRTARLANDAEALARAFEGTGAHRQSSEAVSLAALRNAAEAGLPVLYLAGSLDAKYAAVAQRVAANRGIALRVGMDCGAAFEGVAGGPSGNAFAGVSEVVVIEGAGHNIHLEKPEEFARILGCFAAGAGLAR